MLACGLLAVTGLVVTELASAPTPAQAAASDLLDCTPSSPYVYNLRSPDQTVGGQRVNRVERVNVTTGEVEVIADFSAATAPDDLVIEEQVNGLGIRRDELGRGRWLVFSTSNISDLSGTRNVYQYDLLTETLVSTRIPDEIWSADSNHTTRHGAVDLSTGMYYTATHRSNSDEFTLIAYDLDAEEVWLAGHLRTPGATGSSGDMAFDSLGNLYFIVGGQSAARQFTAPAGTLPTEPGQQIEFTLTDTGGAATDDAAPQQRPPLSRTNGVGVAFGPYGYLYETFASGFLYRVDPSSGVIVPDAAVRPQDVALVDLGPAQPGSTARGGSSTDLATCASPSTIEVRKFVNHREKDSDQFTMSVTREDGEAVGVPATTSGTENGLQQEQVGPVGILTLRGDGSTPWSYTISETGTGATDLSDYDTSYHCVDRNDSSWGPYSGSFAGSEERSFTIETPTREAGAASRAIVCTLTNADPGNPVVVKQFDDETPRAAVDDVTFSGSYRCVLESAEPAVVNEGTWTVEGSGPALLVPESGSTTDVPIGSVCEVREDALDAGVFPDDSWSWGATVFAPETPGDPASGTVTITAEDTLANTVTVTNSARQATAPLQITKSFADGAPDWVEEVAFSGAYDCAYAGLDGVRGTDDDVINTGSWSITGTGEAALDPEASALPVNSVCWITEDTPSDDELPAGAWHWIAPSYEPASDDGSSAIVTIRDAAENRATVTNSASGLSIVKAFPDGAPEWVQEITYTGSYRCETGTAQITGTWSVTGAGIAELSPGEGQPAELPPGASCSASEDTLDPGQLPDESWSWGTPAITPDSVLAGSDPAASTITVTNSVSQETPVVSLNIDKALPEGSPAWLDQLRYTGGYSCVLGDEEYTGTWAVTGAGPAVLTPGEGSSAELPVGAQCTVEEDALDPGLLPDASWTWNAPVIDPQPLELTAEGENTVTVTNGATQATTSLSIAKAFPEDAPSWLGELSYSGRYSCAIGTQLDTGSWSVTGAGAATLLPDEGSSAELPVGAACTVSEGELDPALLPNPSWAWQPPVIDPTPLVLTADGANTVTVTNSASQATTGLSVVKALPEGSPEWLQEITYSGAYACSTTGEENTGTWVVTGAGEAQLAADPGTSSELPAGSSCVVTEEPPAEGLLPNASWSWDQPLIDPVPIVLSAEGPNVVTVTNGATQATAALTVAKAFADGAPEWMEDVAYSGGYACAIGSEESSGTWSVTGSGTAVLEPSPGSVSPAAIPAGSACTVTEDALNPEDLPDELWSWAEPVVDPVPLVLAADAENVVTVTNNASRLPTAEVAIRKAFAEGSPGWMDGVAYTGGFECRFEGAVFAGSWRVTGSGDAVLAPSAEVPLGAECSVSEDAPSAEDLPDASWAWGEPEVSPDSLIVGEAASNVFTVTNSAMRVTGSLQIEKALAPGSPAWLGDITYTGSWSCTLGEETRAGSWSVTGAGSAELRPAAELPVGAVCTVAEDPLDPGELPDGTWEWEQPVIEITRITIASGAPETPVAVVNAARQSDSPAPGPGPEPPHPGPEPPHPGPGRIAETGGGDSAGLLLLLAGAGVLAGAAVLALRPRRR
ncbi:hypothetical protein B4915_14085 [Leucobacter massiliensis]|uniref:Gram-positive cocci surface proteins LPxTG domain-containing protein n=2 Tax=Leucobacter massiliensis TaxID=1686285 RepID=A0A2S9QKD0_9MICO|nr:hypothetical protein B4915_14070 [Leucobacter massiliensis]PRI10044.1 hypothetical protein B4915_14085 [Leucobacter massiliensis]